MKADWLTKTLIAFFVAGVVFTFRYELLFDPIALRAGQLQLLEQYNLQAVRQRIALEETARYIDDQMPTLLMSPDRYALFKKSLAAAKLPGLYCEFGVWKGQSVNFVADLVPQGTVHGFDSFEGNPESWDRNEKGTYAINGLPHVRRNVVLHKGWFDKTVPDFRSATTDPIAFVHIDSDLYSSAKTIFDGLADRFVPGTVIQFDEYFGYPGWKSGEYKAFSEFVDARKLRFSFIGYSKMQVAVVLTR